MSTLGVIPQTDACEERAGALWAVGQRFAAQAGLSMQAAPAELLRGLSRALERFLDADADPRTEHAFVEGAGALLGVLLVRHFGDARHLSQGGVHRVRLGAHGFFDPFAAVERALQSDDPRAELQREVALAEAERHGQGPVARVVRTLTERLARERPELRVVQHFDRELALAHPSLAEPIALDLARAVESTRGQGPAAVERVVGRLLTMLPGGARQALARERLLPRLGLTGQLAELSARGEQRLFAVTLAGDLSIALQVESEGRSRYVRAAETSDAGLDEAAALTLALENLSARSARFRLLREDTPHGPLFVARSGDGLDSARVLLPQLCDVLRARLGTTPCLGIPHRDTFFACAANDTGLVAELARRTAHDAARAPHRLSTGLFRMVGPGKLAAL